MAKTEAAALSVNSVVVPINLLILVTAVVVLTRSLVIIKVAGAAGTDAVTVNNLAVLSALGATLTDEDDPTPFTAFTPNTKEVIAGATLAKLT